MSIQPQPPILSASALSEGAGQSDLVQELRRSAEDLLTLIETMPETNAPPAKVVKAAQRLAMLTQQLLDDRPAPMRAELSDILARIDRAWRQFAPTPIAMPFLQIQDGTPPLVSGDPAVLQRVIFALAAMQPTGPARLFLSTPSGSALTLRLEEGEGLEPPAALAMLIDYIGGQFQTLGDGLLQLYLPGFVCATCAEFDAQTLPHLLDLAGPTMAQELLTRFDADLTRVERDLATAVLIPDFHGLQGATHVLISLSGAAGAKGLCQLARDMNAAGHRSDRAACLALAGPVLVEMARLMAFLHNLSIPSVTDQP
jgi:hypothetical protein